MKRRVARGFVSVAPALGLAALLSACGFFTKQEPPPGPCSRAVILGDAQEMIHFRDGPGRDILDVTSSGRLTRVYADCDYDMKKDRTGVMAVRVYLAMEVERGPASRERTVPFRYFVTLVDQKREPVAKNVFDIAASFPGNVTRMVLTDDTVEMKVPLQAGQGGQDFAVIVGFQLTDAQLEFNRRARLERERPR